MSQRERRKELADPDDNGRIGMVRDLIEAFRAKLAANKNVSVSDLVRLLVLEKELAGTEPVKEIRVRWVQSSVMESEK